MMADFWGVRLILTFHYNNETQDFIEAIPNVSRMLGITVFRLSRYIDRQTMNGWELRYTNKDGFRKNSRCHKNLSSKSLSD